ncbi:MAG: hypothetical protein ACRD2B_13380 [Terriglobia bacterium]
MNRWRILALGLVLFWVGRPGWAGPEEATAPRAVPAASFSQFECTGFISAERLSGEVRVFSGADDNLLEPLHQFLPGDFVYLRRTGRKSFRVGEAYSLVRPETGFGLNPRWSPGKLENQILPPSSWYKLQRFDIKKLGWPYNDTGLVRVVKVTPQGAIARVVFSCSGISAQDIAIPYVPQPIPQYMPSLHLARFALPNGKREGIIVADSSGSAYLARGGIAFLNIGVEQNVRPGQVYRIYAISRQNIVMGVEGLIPRRPPQPRETVGELVILRVQQKSSVGIIVRSRREIAVGDGVELE